MCPGFLLWSDPSPTPLALYSHQVNTPLASPCLLLPGHAVCSPLTACKFGSPCALLAATDVSVKVLRTPDEQQLSLASQQEATRTCCTSTGCSSIVGAAGWSKLKRAQQRTFAAVHDRLCIRHSVLLGSSISFFPSASKIFFFFSPVAFAVQHQGCVPAGLRCVDLIV